MKLLKNKRGIELSINFIVMLILAIAVFAGGLVFTSKFFGQAEKIRGNLDSQTEKQIEKLLDSGSPVVIPVNQKEIFRNKFDTFGVGVLAKASGDYTITVEFNKGIDPKTKDEIDNVNGLSWIEPSTVSQTQNLKKNEKGKFLIGVTVPKGASKGTYMFKLNSRMTNMSDPANPILVDPYDDPLQFIVKVP